MKHTICRRSFLLFSAAALSLSVTAPRIVIAQENPYGEIDEDLVVEEISLSAKELTLEEASENEEAVLASRPETVNVIVELEEPCVLDAGLDPASASGRAYARQLIKEQSSSTEAIRQVCGSESVMKKAEEKGKPFLQFTNVMNGFVMNIPRSMIPQIQKMENVKRVFEDAVHHFGEIEAAQETASQMSTFSQPASYDTDYKGEGLLVGILDTGLDLNHPAFAKEPQNGKIAQDTVFEGIHAEDTYKNAKVPFAYDYGDGDTDVVPKGSGPIPDHGTHIAGIIAGNDEIIQGVLPDAQLAIFKIHNEKTGGVSDSAVIAALEDAVIVKPDAINVSFGIPGGDDGSQEFAEFEAENLALSEIYERVYSSGVMISAACGNNGPMGYMNSKAVSRVPHMGTVDSPSSYEASLAVGSVSSLVNGRYYFRIYDDADFHPFIDPCYGEENNFASLLENGITTGYMDGSGKFGPNDKCKREQFVTFLWRFAGKPASQETKMFADEKEGAYYVDAVSWAAEKAITTGLDDGTDRFGVGMNCTRAMAVTFLSRYAHSEK